MLETHSTRKWFINMAYSKGLVQYNKLDWWTFWYSIDGSTSEQSAQHSASQKCFWSYVIPFEATIILFFPQTYLLKWSSNTDLIKYRNYGFNGIDTALINALFATDLAWHIASSELLRALVLITSQPVISFLSSNLSTNSESFYCFQ